MERLCRPFVLRALGVSGLLVMTGAWLVFAWAGLYPIGSYLSEGDVEPTIANISAIVVTYLVAPVFLVLLWSYAVQRRMPTKTQLVRGAEVLGILVLIPAGAAVIVTACNATN